MEKKYRHQQVSSKGTSTNKMKHAISKHSKTHEETDKKIDIVPHKMRKQ